MPKTRIVEFANSVDPDEVAHDVPPHLDNQCLPAKGQKVWNFADIILLSSFLALKLLIRKCITTLFYYRLS